MHQGLTPAAPCSSPSGGEGWRPCCLFPREGRGLQGFSEGFRPPRCQHLATQGPQPQQQIQGRVDRPGAGQAVTSARRGGRWGLHGAAAGHPLLLLPLLPGLPGGRGGLPGDCAVARGDARAHAHCAPALQGARPRLLEPGLLRAPPFPPFNSRGQQSRATPSPAGGASLLPAGRGPPHTH